MDKNYYGLKIFLNLLKESIVLFVYMLILGVLSAFCLSINSEFTKVFLFVVIILFFVLMCILLTKSFGEKEYKNLVTGNIRRNKANAEDIKKYCKPETEYRFYKGLLLGVIISSITYILLIARLFVADTSSIDGIIRLVNIIYSSPLSLFGVDTSVYYLILFTLINIASCGFGYYIGAKKIMLQQDKLQKTHEEIYGKGN